MVDIISAFMSDKEYICISISDIRFCQLLVSLWGLELFQYSFLHPRFWLWNWCDFDCFFRVKRGRTVSSLCQIISEKWKPPSLNKLFCTLFTWLHHKKQPSWTEQYIRETFSKRDCSTILTVIFRAQNPTVEEEEVSNYIFNSSKKKKKLPYYKQLLCATYIPHSV